MIRAFQWDLARQVERLDWLLGQLPRYADWGYQELHLHLEDAVEYPSLPGVARKDAYSIRQFATLVDAAGRAGINVVPIVNLLGHTQYLIKVPSLRDLNELRASDGSPLERGQICPVHPRTLEVADKLLNDMAPFCTAGKVHVGLDESFHLGRHPLSRAEIGRIGLAAHFAGYVNRLHGLASARGLRLGMWADMLYFLPGAIPKLPRGLIAYDWYYYPFQRLPRVELFNFAERDLAAPLRARGIEYWGCPMNGAFRHEPLPVFGERLANIESWWRRCQRVGAGGMLITSWEPGRLAMEMTTVVDAAAASLWLDRGVTTHTEMVTRGFARVYEVGRVVPNAPVRRGRSQTRRIKDNPPYLQAARAALAADRFPFTGYARWEINGRWDTSASPSIEGSCGNELKFFDHFNLTSGRTLPKPLAASLAFRRYLAARDVFVRTNAQAVFQLRRWLKTRGDPAAKRMKASFRTLQNEAKRFGSVLESGRSAAQAMWLSTRPRSLRSPNLSALDRDADFLRDWQRWLKRAAQRPGLVMRATPVCGAWQLQFVVHNSEPALQKVVVQQRGSDGSWTDLHSRFTIEFLAVAARPRANIRREFSVPVTAAILPLRIAIRGLGRVRISRVQLTDGVTVLHPSSWPRKQARVLGRQAPSRGLPVLDWEKNAGELPIRFGPLPVGRTAHGS